MRRLGQGIWRMHRVMHDSLIKDVLGVMGKWLVEEGWNARGCSAAESQKFLHFIPPMK